MKSVLRILTLSVLAAAVLGAPAGAATKNVLKSGRRAAGAPLTDANIAAIVLAANTIDIENGQLALKNASADTVKSFAHMMITDHSSVNEKARALAGRLKLTPRPSAASRGLVKQMNAKRVALGELSGGDFDKAYLDNEIAYHQSVLDLLDGKLIPSAKNAELKDLLTSVRPAFQAHLDHAKETRAALKG